MKLSARLMLSSSVIQCAPHGVSPFPSRHFIFSLSRNAFLVRNLLQSTSRLMEEETLPSLERKRATARICNVSSFSTELLEMHPKEASLHIVLIPGNPGIISFYKDFIEAIYGLLQGSASITGIGHISHTGKDWESGKMFSLQEQINHKVDFIRQELKYCEAPIILVGHSIGSYICMEVFKKLPDQVSHVIGLYPFLTLNRDSFKQYLIGMIARSSILSASVSSFVSLMGYFPTSISTALVRIFLGQSWSATAVDASCSHLIQYHTMRNVLFMAMTEFTQLSEEPDWAFMKKKQNQLALLFGIDDHWGPLSFFEEVSRQVPELLLSIEREGHTHAFCCTEAGSTWVAHHVATLVRSRFSKLK